METEEVSVGAAVQLRRDYSGDDLRRFARASNDAAQTRRLLSLAVICDGGSGTMAARMGGVGLQIVRDWVMRFNADSPKSAIRKSGARFSARIARPTKTLERPGWDLWFRLN
jgi:hypothetical protein